MSDQDKMYNKNLLDSIREKLDDLLDDLTECKYDNRTD